MSSTFAHDGSICPLVDAVPDPVAVKWSFPTVDPVAWNGIVCTGLNPEGCFQPSLGCFLLRVDSSVVLVDAGIGPGPNRYLGALTGKLPERLFEAGVRPEDIDLVVFTHLHMDHIGWAWGPDGPCFPNARHVAPEKDVAHFEQGAAGMGDHHRAAYAAAFAPLLGAGRVERLADGAEITLAIRYLATPGHTPGHQSVLIHSGANTIAIAGDVFHCPAQVERPDWSHRADHDPQTARASRITFLDRAHSEGWQVAAGHFRPGLQLGRIVNDGAGLRFAPDRDS